MLLLNYVLLYLDLKDRTEYLIMANVKLIRADALEQIRREHASGVPLNRCLKNAGAMGELSSMSLLRMLRIPEEQAITALNPPWLLASGPAMQQQPEEWRFEGRWPEGTWVVGPSRARVPKSVTEAAVVASRQPLAIANNT